ncbi:MAG: VOC family protein [Betaproteobacteria bacterium]|jgi:glyoxylase I family protein|nr:VOC family protein [Betaproteobacteria bacterium]
MFKRIDHVELIPRDLEKTIDFYTKVLGFSVKSRQKKEAGPMKEIVYLTLGDTMMELLDMKDAPDIAPDTRRIGYRMIALEVEDMDKTFDYLKTKGILPSVAPVTLGTSKRAEILDPNGNSIELRQW